MKVFCINQRGWDEKRKFLFWTFIIHDVAGPSYGDECVVEEQITRNGRNFYILKGWPWTAYEAKSFIPLSGIDEVEILKDRGGKVRVN